MPEDAAMLNTGAFLLRRSEWSRSFLRRVWGKQELAAGAGSRNARPLAVQGKSVPISG